MMVASAGMEAVYGVKAEHQSLENVSFLSRSDSGGGIPRNIQVRGGCIAWHFAFGISPFLAIYMTSICLDSEFLNAMSCAASSKGKCPGLGMWCACNKRRGHIDCLKLNKDKYMIKTMRSFASMALSGIILVAANAAFAQVAATTTTITSTGTVSELAPDAIAVKVAASPTPVRYTFTKTTTYVDENGNPVSVETVKTGIPVTVYYEKNGDSFVADKVVVKKTTTTTEATAPATTIISETPAPTSPAANGVVTDAGEGHIDLRTAESPKPIHYKAHDSTAYVDERGNPVPRKILAAGTPVTIFYEQSGDDLFATRVVVKSSALLER